jgi:hypothetical protein
MIEAADTDLLLIGILGIDKLQQVGFVDSSLSFLCCLVVNLLVVCLSRKRRLDSRVGLGGLRQ